MIHTGLLNKGIIETFGTVMLLSGKLYEQEKIRLFKKQEGICPLCGNNLDECISSNHLDHDHTLEGSNAGKVRSLLCQYCNSLEGQIKHKFNSSGLKSRNVEISDWLENLVKYYREDISNNNTHPQFVNDMTKKFSKLDINSMNEMANEYGIVFPPKTTKAKRVPIFKKGLRKYLKENV